MFTFENTARSFVRAPVELTTKLAIGVEEPIPTFPLPRILNSCAPEDDATTNGFCVPATQRTESVAIGVLVPTPKRLLVLSKKKLALFCDTSPPAPMNGTDPAVRPER